MKFLNLTKMDSNSTNLTQENMTLDTSLTSSEDEFVYLNGTKSKGTMTSKMDLIPKKEKNKGKIVNPPTNNEQFNNINTRLDKIIGILERDEPEARAQKSNHRQYVSLSSTNRNNLTSEQLGWLATAFTLLFIVILFVYYCMFKFQYFSTFMPPEEIFKFLGKYWIILPFITLISFFHAIRLYFIFLNKTLKYFQLDIINNKYVSSFFEIIEVLCVLITFIVFLIILVLLIRLYWFDQKIHFF
ncbi:hypothetical protein ACQ4LE_001719 [Meloidogyne hapla]